MQPSSGWLWACGLIYFLLSFCFAALLPRVVRKKFKGARRADLSDGVRTRTNYEFLILSKMLLSSLDW